MTQYTLETTVRRPYDETVEAVRAELATAGFGILSEIDLKATLKAKLDARLKSSWGPAAPSWRTRHCRPIPPSPHCCPATSSSAPSTTRPPSSRPSTPTP